MSLLLLLNGNGLPGKGVGPGAAAGALVAETPEFAQGVIPQPGDRPFAPVGRPVPGLPGLTRFHSTYWQLLYRNQVIFGTETLLVAPVMAAVGAELFTGTGGMAVRLVMASTGLQQFLGTGALAVTLTDAGAGTVTAAGITGAGALTVSLVMAGVGVQTFSGTAALRVALVTAGTGAETESGSGAMAVHLTMTAVGVETFTGSGALAVSLTTAATGAVATGLTGSGALSVTLVIAALGTVVLPITGTGDAAVLISLSGSGTTAAPAGLISGGGGMPTTRPRRWEDERRKVQRTFERHAAPSAPEPTVEPDFPDIGKPAHREPWEAEPWSPTPPSPQRIPLEPVIGAFLEIPLGEWDDEDAIVMLLDD